MKELEDICFCKKITIPYLDFSKILAARDIFDIPLEVIMN